MLEKILTSVTDCCQKNPKYAAKIKDIKIINRIITDFHNDKTSIIIDKEGKILYGGRNIKLSTFLEKTDLKKQILLEISDESSYSTYCEIFGAAIVQLSSSEVKIISGREIIDHYNDRKAFLSCVSHNPGLQFFVDNPEKVALLVIENKIRDRKARALLWTTDSGAKVVDRIYPNDSPLTQEIINYASSLGWQSRQDQSTNGNASNQLVAANGSPAGVIKECVSLRYTTNNFPYLDTFVFGTIDRNNKTIIASSVPRKDTNCLFLSPNGDMTYRHKASCCGYSEKVSDLFFVTNKGRQTSYFCKYHAIRELMAQNIKGASQ